MRFDLLSLGLALGIAGSALAEAPSIFEYRLGDHIIDYPLSELDVISTDLDGFGGQSFIKLNAPNSTEVVLTFRQPRNTLQYLEHDWIDRDNTAPTALSLPGRSEYTFGQTRGSDIYLARGQTDDIWRRNWQKRREAEVALFEYINGFYKLRRKHSALRWKSPVAFERRAA